MKIDFSDDQLQLLERLKFNFDVKKDLSDDEFLEIDHKVSDYFAKHGINENDEVNKVGKMCESIMDLISKH